MCWTRQSGCAVTRSTTAFVSATDVKMVGKHASAFGYADDRTSSLCSSGGCMLFPLKESTSSLLFLRHWSALIIGVAFLHQPGVVATCFVQALARTYLLPTTGRKLTLRCSPRERHVPASQSWLRRPSVFGSAKNMFVL